MKAGISLVAVGHATSLFLAERFQDNPHLYVGVPDEKAPK